VNSNPALSMTDSDDVKAGVPAMVRLSQALLRYTGRNYEIDANIPAASLLGEITTRAQQLLRGYLRRAPGVFLGRKVRVRGRSGLHLARGVSIGDNAFIDARGTVGLVMGGGSRLGRFGVITTTSHLSRLGTGVKIGKNSGIGDFYQLGASGGVTIGDNVIAGPGLYVHSQEHLYADPTRPIRDQGTRQAEVVIDDDCWIGSRVTLLAGTRLGKRTIVAAGSVVRGHHPDGVILAGAPAKAVKSI
jgi:acetyltransferase-like isoleucine patch superfamily enzyme